MIWQKSPVDRIIEAPIWDFVGRIGIKMSTYKVSKPTLQRVKAVTNQHTAVIRNRKIKAKWYNNLSRPNRVLSPYSQNLEKRKCLRSLMHKNQKKENIKIINWVETITRKGKTLHIRRQYLPDKQVLNKFVAYIGRREEKAKASVTS